MAAKKESKPHGEGERKIPVFTVTKNGAILKNIFIVNYPDPPSLPSVFQNPDQEYEVILTVGRHPNCNITLTHPSISRFHLQIHSEAYKQRFSVKDLSSSNSFFSLPKFFFGLWYWVFFYDNNQAHDGFLVIQCMGPGFRRRSWSRGNAWSWWKVILWG